MRRLWQDGSPSSECVVQDVKKLAHANLPIIKEHSDALVPDLGNRWGNRCPNKASKSKNWCSNRAKNDVSEFKEKCIHPDDDAAIIGVVAKAAKLKTECDVKVESFLKSDS